MQTSQHLAINSPSIHQKNRTGQDEHLGFEDEHHDSFNTSRRCQSLQELHQIYQSLPGHLGESPKFPKKGVWSLVLMIFDDAWWFLMIVDDFWWSLSTIGTNSQSIVTESMVSYVSWKKLLTENPRSSNRAWVVHFSAGTCDKDRGVGFLLRNDLDDLLWTWHQRSGTGETGGTGQFRLPVIQHQDVNDKYDN